MELPLQMSQNYLKRRQEDLKACFAAFEKNEFSKIVQISHKIKGSAVTFGHMNLMLIAQDLELAAKLKNEEDVRSLLVRFSTWLSEESN